MSNKHTRTLILGIGNFLLGDEGIGVHVARYLIESGTSDGIECIEGGTGGFLLLEPMQKAEKVIIVDAILDGKPCGSITRLTPKYSKDYPVTLCAHDIGLKDLLDALFILDSHPEIILLAVSIKEINDFTTELSKELSAKVKEISDLAVREAQSELSFPFTTN